MPKIDFNDAKGVYTDTGTGWLRNGARISASADELNQYTLTGKVKGLNSGGKHVYVPVPATGTLVAAYSSVSGDPGAETLIRIHNGAGSSLGDITIENGSAAGSADSLTGLTSAVEAGDYLRAISNNGASNAVDSFITFVIKR